VVTSPSPALRAGEGQGERVAATVQYQTSDGIASIAIDRPARKNALDLATYGALADAFEAAVRDDSVRAIVLSGAPDVFCAGNDIGDFLAAPSVGPGDAPVRFMQALSKCPVPVIAAVRGPAVGIGTTMLLHCDLVYCADTSRFSLPFVNLGLCPEFAVSMLLPLAAGYHRAAEKLLLGDPISAEDALEMGIVNRIVPDAEVLPLALRQAARIGALAPGAVRETKRLLKAGTSRAVDEVIGAELASFAQRLRSPEARTALESFLAGKK
jgi:enoyl-CoA hydratase/carnithine racemase